MTRLLVLLILIFCQAPAQTAQQRLAEVQEKLKRLDPATIQSLLAQAVNDPDGNIRYVILDRLGRTDNPQVRQALERHAATDPDPRVALVALERLRVMNARALGELFEKRLALAASQKDEKALKALEAAHQRWATHARGAVLPAFFQQPPPVFQVPGAGSSIRVAVIADFGQENEDQRAVAAAVAAVHRRQPFSFGITLGDNIVPDGVTDPADPRWKTGWEQIYDTLGIPFFAVTGNHDWGFADSPAGEILYSRQSRSWRMPALYYSFTAGPAQFFALATHAFSHTQLRWLETELARSRARWKIVYGHHPIYSYGTHGDTPELKRLLLPVLKGRAQIYLAGHDHLPQYLQPEGGVHFFVGPAAGQSSRPERAGPLTIFSGSFYGFMALDISAERVEVAFFGSDGRLLYKTDIGN